MSDWTTAHLKILAKMVRVPVTGRHHKQRDTIQQWVDLPGDEFTAAMDDLVRRPEAPVVQTARDTVKLTSVHETKAFIETHDTDGRFSWYL